MTNRPLDYSKFDQLNFSSDEDDCHPNIEINTWRRLKERMRNEKGLTKREPELHDKWNSTNINRKHKIVVPDTDTSKKETTASEATSTESGNSDATVEKDKTVEEKHKETEENAADKDTHKTTAQNGSESQHADANTNGIANENADKNKDKDKDKDTNVSQAKSAGTTTQKAIENEETDGGVVFEARSDPGKFLNEHMKRLKKFAKLEGIERADKFIRQRPYLVHEASEGYLITYAVDRAVEGADTREIERISERCLQIHNLVQSCQTGNVKPEIGVEIFYKKLAIPHLMSEYRKELAKQQMELMQRIEMRRIERIREMEDQMEAEKAPVGPGGLDPTEVLNSLPQSMQDAFMTQDVDKLKEVIAKMDPNEAAYHMKRCVDAGLWVENAEDANNIEHDAPDID